MVSKGLAPLEPTSDGLAPRGNFHIMLEGILSRERLGVTPTENANNPPASATSCGVGSGCYVYVRKSAQAADTLVLPDDPILARSSFHAAMFHAAVPIDPELDATAMPQHAFVLLHLANPFLYSASFAAQPMLFHIRTENCWLLLSS